MDISFVTDSATVETFLLTKNDSFDVWYRYTVNARAHLGELQHYQEKPLKITSRDLMVRLSMHVELRIGQELY